MSTLPTIREAVNVARANEWGVGSCPGLVFFERPHAALEVRHRLSDGRISRVVITRTGNGIDAVDPHDLIAILNSETGLRP